MLLACLPRRDAVTLPRAANAPGAHALGRTLQSRPLGRRTPPLPGRRQPGPRGARRAAAAGGARRSRRRARGRQLPSPGWQGGRQRPRSPPFRSAWRPPGGERRAACQTAQRRRRHGGEVVQGGGRRCRPHGSQPRWRCCSARRGRRSRTPSRTQRWNTRSRARGQSLAVRDSTACCRQNWLLREGGGACACALGATARALWQTEAQSPRSVPSGGRGGDPTPLTGGASVLSCRDDVHLRAS